MVISVLPIDKTSAYIANTCGIETLLIWWLVESGMRVIKTRILKLVSNSGAGPSIL